MKRLSKVKRQIYGLPIMKFYRDFRTQQLSQRFVKHDEGFWFSGLEAVFSADWERSERAALGAEMASNDVLLDIGANHGFYTCWFAQNHKHVLAFEPEEGNLRFLKENVQKNGFENVEVFPVALSDSAGLIELFGDGDCASLNAGWHGASRQFRQLVPRVRLDDLIGQRFEGQKILVKLDVEGHELEVLRGAQELLSRETAPTWLIESFPYMQTEDRRSNPGHEELLEMMERLGYSRTIVSEPNHNYLFRRT